jgi:thiol-disulfide isomerase/thioredoxin
MKKFFPVLMLIFAFSGFLAGQVFFEMIDSKAGQFGKSKEKFGLYENLYQELELKTTKGSTFKLKEQKSPVVILNFWASWCQPCLKEFASLTEFKKKYPDEKVLVIGINNDEENQKKLITKTEKKYNLNFESVQDTNSTITSRFLISEIPVSIIYSNGKVMDVTYGETEFTSKDFTSQIDQVLESKNIKK